MSNKSLQKSIDVQLSFKKVTIKKLGLGRYTEILHIGNELIKKMFSTAVNSFESESELNMTDDVFIAHLLLSITEYQSEIIKLIHIATYDPEIKDYSLTIEELENDIGLEEAIELIQAAMEVNNIFKVFDNIKKLKAITQK